MKEMSRKTLGVKKSNEGLMSTANISKNPVRRVVEANKSTNKPMMHLASLNGFKDKTAANQQETTNN